MQTGIMITTHQRTTKYVIAVRDYMVHVGHATNTEILEHIRRSYPAVSATTVHRVTARMMKRGELQVAPSRDAIAVRFDANLAPHDHFMCTRCGILKDTDLQSQVRPIIEAAIGNGCSISGRLVISGLCKECVYSEDAEAALAKSP